MAAGMGEEVQFWRGRDGAEASEKKFALFSHVSSHGQVSPVHLEPHCASGANGQSSHF